MGERGSAERAGSPGAATIRRLGEQDAAIYRAGRLAALRAAPDAFGSTFAIEAPRPLAAHAERLRTSIVAGAFCGAGLVGMAGFKRSDGPKEAHKGFLWGFYVDPAHRRGGIGGALLSAVLAGAREQVEQVTLSVVAGNTAAIALYRRFGFRRYGREPRSLRCERGYADEEMMVLFLDTAPAPSDARPWPE